MTSTDPYLLRLAVRLNAGLSDLDDASRDRHRDFLLTQQVADGGFSGRDEESDLYYTSFAVRALAMLDRLTPEQCRSIADFLRGYGLDRLTVIDLANWLSTAMLIETVGGLDLLADADSDGIARVTETFEGVRTEDGGYAKSPEGTAGSTYHSFLIVLTYELLGQPVPNPNRLVQFLYDRQRDDGGFVEIAPMKRSGTNPTAAAVALLTIFGYQDEELREDVGGFLREVRSPEGGFQANTRIPFADGLSTFTGLLTVADLGLRNVLDPHRVKNYVRGALECPEGGFRGASWDEQADVEYTFYGLGILGLLGTR